MTGREAFECVKAILDNHTPKNWEEHGTVQLFLASLNDEELLRVHRSCHTVSYFVEMVHEDTIAEMEERDTSEPKEDWQ